MFATLNPGDEVLFLDPYFVMYKHLPKLCGGMPVSVDTYPDFRLHPDRLEAAITPRIQAARPLQPQQPHRHHPAPPTNSQAAAAIAKKHNLLVISDEIYDAFCYEPHHSIAPLLPDQCILLKGFSKTYGMTGWRLGYAAGPKAIIDQMTKLQQYTFVCAPPWSSTPRWRPSPTTPSTCPPTSPPTGKNATRSSHGLNDLFEINHPGGAFYVFPKVPGRRVTATAVRANAPSTATS